MTIIHRSKNHINIMNLLSKCEYRFQLINDKCDWRLEQVIIDKHTFDDVLIRVNFSFFSPF